MTLTNSLQNGYIKMAQEFLEPLQDAGYFDAHLNLNNPGSKSLVEQLAEYIKVLEYNHPNSLQLKYEELEGLEWTIFSLHSSGHHYGQQIDIEFFMLYDPHMLTPYFEINGLRYSGADGTQLYYRLNEEVPPLLELIVAARHPHVSSRRSQFIEQYKKHQKKL